jgi:hypothetical protein
MYDRAIETLIIRITCAVELAARAYDKDEYVIHRDRAAEYMKRLRVLKRQRFWHNLWNLSVFN